MAKKNSIDFESTIKSSTNMSSAQMYNYISKMVSKVYHDIKMAAVNILPQTNTEFFGSSSTTQNLPVLTASEERDIIRTVTAEFTNVAQFLKKFSV
jgi:hypothetical protein